MQKKEINLIQNNSIYKQINLIIHYKNHLNNLKEEISHARIEEQLKDSLVQNKIKQLEVKFKLELCSDIPTAFWDRKKYQVELSYEEGFIEKKYQLN